MNRRIPLSRQAGMLVAPEVGLLTADYPQLRRRPPSVLPRSVPVERCPQREEGGHHWRLASPNGATVRGVCKHCGLEREYRSGAADTAFAWGRVPLTGEEG